MQQNRDRRDFWQAHWQRCRELGMTLKDYAEQEGLTLTVFYGWSKRFKREAKVPSAFSRVTVLPETSVDYRLRFSRRKFFEADKAQDKKRPVGNARKGLSMIQKLYGIEQSIKDKWPDERQYARQQQAWPVLEQLHAWALRSVDQVPSTSLTGKALSYLLAQWPKLIPYVEDGRLSMDNNATERAIRPFVIGRRNWLFADTQNGATASANLYSLIETAKLNGIEPYIYLRHIFKALPAAQSTERLEALLPFNLNTGSLAQEAI